jgi:hypothetical protein
VAPLYVATPLNFAKSATFNVAIVTLNVARFFLVVKCHKMHILDKIKFAGGIISQ